MIAITFSSKAVRVCAYRCKLRYLIDSIEKTIPDETIKWFDGGDNYLYPKLLGTFGVMNLLTVIPTIQTIKLQPQPVFCSSNYHPLEEDKPDIFVGAFTLWHMFTYFIFIW